METGPIPQSVTYAARLLYVAAAVFFIEVYFLGNTANMPLFDVLLLMVIPVAGMVYFIRLLTKGVFWVRSVFLAITIIHVFNLITGKLFVLNGTYLVAGLFILLMQVAALRLLYKKESNAWYTAKLMDDNLKRLKKRGNLFGNNQTE
jgi:hypothetical protein